MVRIMYSNKLRNMELPENLFSNLGEMKVKSSNINIKNDDNEINIKSNEDDNLGFIKENNKFINYPDANDYRDRISKMYDEIEKLSNCDDGLKSHVQTFLEKYVEVN